MTPWGDYRAKLIEIAEGIAKQGASDNADFLRRFRVVYRHLVTTVDGSATALGMGPFGPMEMGMGMPVRPDVEKLFADTDQELGTL
jgi:hypothetical protein